MESPPKWKNRTLMALEALTPLFFQWCTEVTYIILNISSLSVDLFANIFSHYGLVFSLAFGVFWRTEFQNVNVIKLWIFVSFFIVNVFGVLFKKYFYSQDHEYKNILYYLPNVLFFYFHIYLYYSPLASFVHGRSRGLMSFFHVVAYCLISLLFFHAINQVYVCLNLLLGPYAIAVSYLYVKSILS